MGEFADFALAPEQGVVPQMEQLDPEMRGRIRQLAAGLNVRDAAAVQGFGARAQKEMGTFTDIALARMLDRGESPLSGTMQALCEEIRACSFASQAKGLFQRMFKKASSLEQVRSAYEKAEPRINALADEMTDRRVELMRDSALLDRIYERNEALYREICSLLVVGDQAIRQAKERGEDAQIVQRLVRRIEDIRVTQAASTQLAAQIRMVQASGEAACEKLRTAVEVTIPLWKSQMAAALGLARATDALAMGTRAQKEAARGVRDGAQELRAQRDAYGRAARESDREQAQRTADELLQTLAEIEQDLAAKRLMQEAAGTD